MAIKLAGCNIYKNNSLLLLHRIDSNHWEFPGGKVNEGETLEQTALREGSEEIGCDIKLIKYVGSVPFYHKGEQMESNQFDAEIIKGRPKLNEPETFDDVKYIPIKDLEKFKLAPNVKLFYEKHFKKMIK